MIKIYTTNWCGSCVAAKNLLNELNINFKEINIEKENMSREDLHKLTDNYTVPQIIIDNNCIGGYNQLLYLHQNNKLIDLINDK